VSDAVVFALVVGAVLGLGIALGMLVAPRLSRLAERDEEEPGGDERG
jgi:hypothetical protein